MGTINQDDVLDFTNWVKQKADLKFNKDTNFNFPILNNCVYWAFMGSNIGSEEGKHRPILITRTYINSTICAVIPLTTQRLGDGYWYHIDLQEIDSTALVEQMRTIDLRRIDKPYMLSGKIVKLNFKELDSVNTQIEYLYSIWKPDLKTKYMEKMGLAKVKINL